MWIKKIISVALSLSVAGTALAQSPPPDPGTVPVTSPATSPSTTPPKADPKAGSKGSQTQPGPTSTQTTRPQQPTVIPLDPDGQAPRPLYRFQVGDLIRIEVSSMYRSGAGGVAEIKHEMLAPVDQEVATDGNISAPYLGLVRAEGRTVTELYEYLKVQYMKLLATNEEALRLIVVPLKIRQIRATVSGAANKNGVFEVKRGDRLSTLVASAQGVPFDGSADLHRATLRRGHSREVIPIDLYDILAKGDASQDFEVEDGDILNVPTEINNRISVDGEVKQPVVIPYTEGISVAQAITRAGGRTDNSRMTKVTVVRLRPGRPDDPEYITLDLVAFFNRKDKSQNIELKPGDMVYVPNNGNVNTNLIGTAVNLLYLLKTIGFNPLGF